MLRPRFESRRETDLITLDGLSSPGQEADEGGLASGRLDDPAPVGVLVPVQEIVRKSDHLSEPVHHDRLQLGAGRARSLERRIVWGCLFCNT